MSMVMMIFLARAAVSAEGHAGSSAKSVACFFAEGFPTADAPPISEHLLRNALRDFNTEYFGTADLLSASLAAGNFRALLLPYGSAFPEDAWPAIQEFISRGGSLIVLGGSPFHQPVIFSSGKWIRGTPQPTYAHRLLIGPADSVVLDSSPYYSKNARLVSPEGSTFDAAGFQLPAKVYELTVRFTTRNDFADEIGSAGPRDAVLRPLVQIINGDSVPIASPLLEIDRLRGPGAGGRWIFEPSDAKLDEKTIRYCVERSLEGASAIEAAPVQACVEEHGMPAIRITRFRPNADEADGSSAHAVTAVYDAAGTPVFKTSTELAGTREFMSAEIQIRTNEPLQPGFYKAEVKIADAAQRQSSAVTGFWVMERDLMDSGPRLSVSRDWLLKDGRIFPVVGTSYMAADAERKFLLEPNPYVWEKDFSRMEKLGVNFVRTGLWPDGTTRCSTLARSMKDSYGRSTHSFSPPQDITLSSASTCLPSCLLRTEDQTRISNRERSSGNMHSSS